MGARFVYHAIKRQTVTWYTGHILKYNHMTEKLTPNKFGEEKSKSGVSQKTGKAYAFKTIGFVSNEYTDRWYNINYNDRNPLTLGKTYELETSSREYNGKTYYDAKFPKRENAQPSQAMIYLTRNVDATLATAQMLLADFRMLVKRLETKGVLDDLSEPQNTRKIVYPESHGQPDFGETDEEPPVEAYEEN